MSDKQPNEDDSSQVETFRDVPGDEWSEEEEEESSGDSSGCLKIAYSCSDITEELIKNGDTLYKNVIQDGHRDDEPIYENVVYGADGSKSTFYDEYLDGWSSSEFDDSDEGSGQGQTETSGPRSFDFFKKKKKNKMILPKLSMGSGQDALMMMSKGKSSIFEGFRRNAMQSTVLDKISKFGQKRSKQDDPSDPDLDLQPLNFCVGNEEFKPACLPELLPEDITSMQLKRRQIISVIVESERSYLFSLKRLIEEYQLPLLQSQPSIIDRKHVKVIFHKVRDIIQCHLLFHGELHNVAKRWDEEEMIGDVFVASFSKSMVFEAYSSFVNNFPTAMDRAKKQARLKSAFNAFLQNKLDTSSDKLSLFGLMVKPIQRFPQFIMLIQDLLKNTPKDHRDRLSLQWALTELEMLTDRLNETKKECESLMEARRLYKALHLGGITNRPQEVQSLFIRQDDVMQHKVRDGETESKMKRLFMLSDQLVCASVNKNKETVDPSDSILSSGEKLVVSWSAPVKDIDVVDPTLPSLKNHPSISRQSSQSSGKKPSKISSPAPPTTTSNPYRRDLDNMLHDLTILEKMLNLHSHLILKYEALPEEYLKTPIKSLEMLIRQKIDIDKNIVIISIPSRSALLMDGVSNMMGSVTSSISEQMSGRGRRIVTLEFSSLTMKHDWLIELQSAKLATDPNNFPAWFLSENDPLSSRNPRFMKELKVDVITKEDKKMTLKPLMTKKKNKDELNCCTYITLPCHNKIGSGMRHLWVCIGGRAAIVSLHTDQPFVVECFNVTDGNIVASDCVVEPRFTPDLPDEGRSREVEGGRREGREIVWMISDDNKIFMVPAIPSERQSAIKPMKVEGALVMCIKYLNNRVYLGASDGTLLIYTRNAKDEWNFASPQKLWVGNEAVSFLMVADDNAMWASCSSTVHILDQQTSSKDSCRDVLIKTSHDLTNDASFKNNGTPSKKDLSISIECMVKAGVGLLVSFANQSTVRLFHAETFRHLQDINVSSAVNQLLEEKGSSLKPEKLVTNLSITCMLQNKGILYIGTSQGFVLTLPLPRLNGMPQFRQRPAISFQGHVGPVKFLASINCSLVDSSADKQAKGNPKEVLTSHRASSDTLIDEEHLTPPSQKVSEPMESMKNGIHEPIIPPPVTPSLSSSTPDLTSLQTDHVDMKLQQMKVLYESLFRGVSENSDDSAVLQRIASTPLPRRRLQNIIKNVLVHDTTVTPPLIISSFNPENSDGMMRCQTNAKRIAKMRHSTSELLEAPSVGARKILQQSIKTSAAAQSIMEEESREQKSPIVHESEEKGTLKPNESHKMNDESIEKDEETRRMVSHLNKSVSSASDTPSQKSSSSTSSSVKIQNQDEKFPSVSRFSVPSNTAMISSTLTTTPKSRATVFVSAGKGHVPWNSTSKSDGSPEKPCLLLWMC